MPEQAWPATKIYKRDPKKLKPNSRNARTHSDRQVDQIIQLIERYGWTNPPLIDENDVIIAGHGRQLAAIKMELKSIPVVVAEGWTEEEKRAYVIADNKVAMNAGWDMLAEELNFINEQDIDMSMIGFSDEELAAILNEDDTPPPDVVVAQKGALSDRFGIPPFSVLNAREGWWQNRKRLWLALGIQSELGRGDDLIPNGGGMASMQRQNDEKKGLNGLLMKSLSSHPRYYEQKERAERKIGRQLTNEEFEAEHWVEPDSEIISGTSIFDPVLCELSYRWYSPVGGTVLDPFAGGSVRGIVASYLDRKYVGVELRAEQVEANKQQSDIAGDEKPVWINGDSTNIEKLAKGTKADFLFSCPPYADLEVYSDDERDISNMEYPAFIEQYRKIIKASCRMLKANRFACFVVGDVRHSKQGYYRNFVSDTIEAFRDAGLELYNECILVTATGSLAMRVGKQFTASRKVGKSHQNVLVFVKGDPFKAAKAIGDVEFGEVDGLDTPESTDSGDDETPDFGEVL